MKDLIMKKKQNASGPAKVTKEDIEKMNEHIEELKTEIKAKE